MILSPTNALVSCLPTCKPTRPIPRNLIIPRPVILILLRNPSLNRIIRHWFRKKLTRELQYSVDSRAGLPLIRPQHPQAHTAFIIVAYVRVVDFGCEGDGGGFEGVFGGKFELDEEGTVLGLSAGYVPFSEIQRCT